MASFWRRGAKSGMFVFKVFPQKGDVTKGLAARKALCEGVIVPRLRVMPETGTKTIHIKTFGCQMNVYDSNRMLSLLEAQGFKLEPELRRADVILINTCSIRAKAEQKVLSLLGELKPLKDANPNRVIGVAGCVGQRMGRNLLQRVPHLDLVLGPDQVDQIGELVGAALSHGKRTLTAKLDEDGRTYSQPAVIHRAKPAEFLTIMKGCDHFCTYCIVPFVRGREKSRTITEIIDDVKKLVAHGTKEITFLGQNINTYGKGTPENLAMLIEAAHEVEGIERIRYVTSHPRDMGQDMIDQFGTLPKLMPALHLPFQSGSDSVLKRMSRLYTSGDYLKKVELLRKANPEIALSTDAIIGFPGETDEEFEATLKLLDEVKFSGTFLFKYSPRPGTRAFTLGSEVPEAIKDERLKRAQDVANKYILAENQAMVGKTFPVLVENLDKMGWRYAGRTPSNKLIHIENAGHATLGKIIDVEMTEVTLASLRGFYVGAPRTPNLPRPARLGSSGISPAEGQISASL